MTENSTPSLQETLLTLVADTTRYFDETQQSLIDAAWTPHHDDFWNPPSDKNAYWEALSEPLQLEAQRLVKRLLAFAKQLVSLVRSSALNSDADQHDLTVDIKTMRSALMLRRFWYEDMHVIDDQGEFRGIYPASQSDDQPLEPMDAKRFFTQCADR